MATGAGQAASETARQLQQAAAEAAPMTPGVSNKQSEAAPSSAAAAAPPSAAVAGQRQQQQPPAAAAEGAGAAAAAGAPPEDGLESLMEDHRTILRLFDQCAPLWLTAVRSAALSGCRCTTVATCTPDTLLTSAAPLVDRCPVSSTACQQLRRCCHLHS
jgi:hypothetical protein